MIHRRTLCTIILTAAWIVCGTFDFAAAVPNPQAIAWQGPPETVVSSMYRGVLGREPATAEDMNTVRALARELNDRRTSPYQLFWRFINSREYQAGPFARAARTYRVYWKTRNLELSGGGMTMCHCYYFTDDAADSGYMPSLQYTGVPDVASPLTYGEAAALTRLYALSDRNTCPHADCGGGTYRRDNGGGGNYAACRDRFCPECGSSVTLLGQAAGPECEACLARNRESIERCLADGFDPQPGPDPGGVNLVQDEAFAGFGFQGGAWSQWTRSRNAQAMAQTVRLGPGEPAETALYIRNNSPLSPHVYGTTHQQVAVQQGRTYRLSLLAKGNNLGSSGSLNIAVDSAWRVRPVGVSRGSYGWREFSGTFTAEAPRISVRIISEDVGEVWLTRVSIRPE